MCVGWGPKETKENLTSHTHTQIDWWGCVTGNGQCHSMPIVVRLKPINGGLKFHRH